MVDPLHDLTIVDVLAEHRRSRPGHRALVCGETTLTYPELDERANRLAHALTAAGVHNGSIVLWLAQNCHRLVESLLACAKIGAVFCPANWRQSVEETLTLLADTAPPVVLWQDTEIGETVRAARNGWSGTARWIQLDGPEDSYEAFLGGGKPEAPIASIDSSLPLLQLYTGAFGGTPNGAQLSHSAILAQDLVVAMAQQITEETVYLNSGPMFHMATLMTTFATFRMGGTNVLTRRVDAEELSRIIAEEGCNFGFVMGPTAKQILEVNKEGRYDLSGFRTFGGNDAWNAMVQVDTSPWARHPAGYGQTEVTGLLTFNAFGVGALGTSGRPSPLAQVRIVDPEGDDVPVGETGEIVVRGPIVISGYHARDDLNRQRCRGGWWHTGDLGRREDDGSVSFVAPLTRIVKSAAENIYPAEVEGCLQRHPAVKEAAIIGVPDRTWSQRVVAIVVLEPDAEVSEDELIAHCKEHIASYKKPSAVEFVDLLPRQGFAVDYDALDERFGGGGYPGSG